MTANFSQPSQFLVSSSLPEITSISSSSIDWNDEVSSSLAILQPIIDFKMPNCNKDARSCSRRQRQPKISPNSLLVKTPQQKSSGSRTMVTSYLKSPKHHHHHQQQQQQLIQTHSNQAYICKSNKISGSSSNLPHFHHHHYSYNLQNRPQTQQQQQRPRASTSTLTSSSLSSSKTIAHSGRRSSTKVATKSLLNFAISSNRNQISQASSNTQINTGLQQQRQEMPPPATLPPRYLVHEKLMTRLQERARLMRLESRSSQSDLNSSRQSSTVGLKEEEKAGGAQKGARIFPGVISFAEAMNTSD